MEEHDRLREHFEGGLDRIEAAAAVAAEGAAAGGEAHIDTKIRVNVVGILRKMYGIYYNAAWHGRGPVQVLRFDSSLPREEQLRAAFDRFTSLLRQEWQEKLAKDELFGRTDEARKGRVMLDTLREAEELLASLTKPGS